MRRVGLGVVLVLASGTAVAAWQPQRVAQALDDHQPGPALRAFNARLASKPEEPEARVLKGMALAESGGVVPTVGLYEALSRPYPLRARV